MAAELSVIITARDCKDPKLIDLLYSIEKQTFRNFEILIITEGNPESAKAIGLKRAKGKIVCILASDNYLNDSQFFEKCLRPLQEDKEIIGSYPIRYWHYKDDNILNRYFALFGVNDPIPFYLGKADRETYFLGSLDGWQIKYIPLTLDKVFTLGDNGFFIRKDILMKADIEHYFHIDVCQDLFNLGYKTYAIINTSIWHRTGDNIIQFFKKRLKYADKFAENRRWHMVEKKDLPKLLWFIFCTLTIIQPLYLSVKGYKKVKDIAWFLHPFICLITLGVYGVWIFKKFATFAVCNSGIQN